MMGHDQNQGTNKGLDVVVIILMISLMTVTGTADDEKNKFTDYFDSSSEIDIVFGNVEYSTLKDMVSAFDQIRLYYHVEVGKRLISRMKVTKNLGQFQKKTNFQTKGFEPGKERHNINIHGGRAAWAFERFFDVTLPKITSKSGKDEFATCRERAKKYLNAYQEGLIAASSRQHKSGISIQHLVDQYKNRTARINKFSGVYRSAIKKVKNRYQFGVSTEDLIKKYSDKITPGLTNGKIAETSGKHFKKLLAEWMPIGKPLSDLTRIVGEDPEKQSNGRRKKRYGDYHYYYHYYFDNGLFGPGYGFFVESGTIRSVKPAGVG